MEKQFGVELHIIRTDDKKTYKRLPTPESTRTIYDKLVSYIEVDSGERFEVIVQLHPEFDFKGQSHVRVECTIGSNTYSYQYSEEQRRREMVDGVLTIRCAHDFRFVRGNYMKFAFQFAELVKDEDDDLEPDFSKHGQIRVRVQRGTSVEPSVLGRPVDLPDIPTAHKDVLRAHISHTVIRVPLDKRSLEWNKSSWIFENAKGGIGMKNVVFNIRYRSRLSLQFLRVIPKD